MRGRGMGREMLEKEGKGECKDEARQQWQEVVDCRRDLGQYRHRHGELG